MVENELPVAFATKQADTRHLLDDPPLMRQTKQAAQCREFTVDGSRRKSLLASRNLLRAPLNVPVDRILINVVQTELGEHIVRQQLSHFRLVEFHGPRLFSA